MLGRDSGSHVCDLRTVWTERIRFQHVMYVVVEDGCSGSKHLQPTKERRLAASVLRANLVAPLQDASTYARNAQKVGQCAVLMRLRVYGH